LHLIYGKTPKGASLEKKGTSKPFFIIFPSKIWITQFSVVGNVFDRLFCFIESICQRFILWLMRGGTSISFYWRFHQLKCSLTSISWSYHAWSLNKNSSDAVKSIRNNIQFNIVVKYVEVCIYNIEFKCMSNPDNSITQEAHRESRTNRKLG
jgi:hypothetical protein